MQTESIKNHQYVSHAIYPNTCAVCEKTPFHENHSPFRKIGDVQAELPAVVDDPKRTYDKLCEHLKSEAKEKAYEPPFPYETQEPVPITTSLVETDAGYAAEPILRELMQHVNIDAIYEALRVIGNDLGHIRLAAATDGVKTLTLMGIPIVLDATMQPGTWKLVVSKLPTQMCDINR